MLEKPAIPDERICAKLRAAYGLNVTQLTFLPLGADVNTAVYRAVSADDTPYFLKLRSGSFYKISVLLPAYLRQQGITAVVAPLPARNGQLWVPLGTYRLLLYPFVDGQNGYERALSPRQWREFGAALRALHAIHLPAPLARLIPREDYSPHGRQQVSAFLGQAQQQAFNDPCADQLAALMRQHAAVIQNLVQRADQLARELQARPRPLVLCHNDIHAGNLLFTADGPLSIVDWDAPLLAPRERDLGLPGGCDLWNRSEDLACFFEGYGQAKLDRTALAYYRSERVIQDMAEFGKQLFLSTAGGADREQALVYFASNFLPGHEIDLANQTG